MGDDEQSWMLGGRWIRTGAENALQLGAEYDITRATSVELEWTAQGAGGVERDEGARQAELEFKHVFNDIARDGFGTAVSVTGDLNRSLRGPGTRRGWMLQLPLSLPLWGGQDGFVHFNLGWQRWPTEPVRAFQALAVERRIAGRTWAFGEVVRQEGRDLLHTGIRHWLRPDRLALDLSVQRQRGEERWHNGVVIGLVAYDL